MSSQVVVEVLLLSGGGPAEIAYRRVHGPLAPSVHPDAAAGALAGAGEHDLLLHSTSWRYDTGVGSC
ncbi:hypothetical protein [Spongiactinospora sp. TRM90649]|uniref:hypothetical protein n=1 Tax=Spongiactinospora sp. TRM90649 TaxID=3031114 RepID=UPI0023F8A67D|nr:hypothetical protein [Spongiactinospora sp. TRM90649]MDF5753284.1 hypothetical protein [Spongiactinospora sp. TRM90649]